MIFEEKTIILKDGRTAILKSPCVEDAEKLLNYIKKSCSETDFLARYRPIFKAPTARRFGSASAARTDIISISKLKNAGFPPLSA